MATVTGTIKVAAGKVTLRWWGMKGPRVNTAGEIDSNVVRMVETDNAGAFSVVIPGGEWIVTWPNGSQISRLDVTVPDGAGTYPITSLLPATPTFPDPAMKWFTNIQDMVSADSRYWTDGRTRNSYGNDGIISGWDLILKSSSQAAGLVANGDSVLETQDGLAFCVRKFIAS